MLTTKNINIGHAKLHDCLIVGLLSNHSIIPCKLQLIVILIGFFLRVRQNALLVFSWRMMFDEDLSDKKLKYNHNSNMSNHISQILFI